MSKETFALINDNDQVVNHIVIDKDDANFESNMAGQLAHWGCVRYVETTLEDVIILDESPTIWTTHTETDGFVLPEGYRPTAELIFASEVDVTPHPTVMIKGRKYPTDSLLIKENASERPEGWVLPEGVAEVTLADAD
jgi:hypothetical protein